MVKRYQRGNQKPKIKEGQTTQWSKDTKGIIRSRKSKKDRQHNGQKIPKGGSQKPKVKEGQTTQWSKDTKGVIRSRKSKKDRQYNG
jgi:hypothetical protein